MTEIKIEIFYEEAQRVVNIIDFSVEQEIDVLSFNADDYMNLINNVDFINAVNKSVISSDSWLFDYNKENSERLDLNFMKKAVVYDNIMIRVTKVGNRDLSFLSINNDGDNTDHYKEFLKGKIDESFSVEDYFSDWCSDSRFSLDSVLNL